MNIIMKNVGLLLLITASFSAVGQDNNCDTNIVGLNEKYEGDCKRGLAHGKGTAIGELGKYTGDFKKGFPDGKGEFIYVDGSVYDGEWDRGNREGYGLMTYPNDSIVKGFWKEDRYMGLYEKPWEIIQSRGNARYRIIKMSDAQSKVEIKFFRGGLENPSAVESMNLSATTGVQYNTPGYMGFEQVEYPVELILNYRVPNQLNTSIHQEYARIKIYEPGGWLIRVNY